MRAIILIFSFFLITIGAWSQKSTPEKKVSVVGAARSQFYGDQYAPSQEDSVTAKKLNSGNVLADLGLKIQANSNMEVLGMVRIRNDYGGFWGSGVSFDVRQLTVKGVIGNAVRYQLGDINYRMTPYTLWNYDQEILSTMPTAFLTQMQAVNYDHFYNQDHAWRQQGASANVGFLLAKGIKEIQLKAVSTRIKTSDFSNQSDRIFVGLNANVIQSDALQLGLNYADVMDIVGTSRNQTSIRNPIFTGSANWRMPLRNATIRLSGEAGVSSSYTKGLDLPIKNGRFNDWRLNWTHQINGFSFDLRYQYVNAQFRSPGAQTRRINPTGELTSYTRVGNDQTLRALNMMDIMRESNLYNMQLQTSLGQYLPQYDNITPYGDATPNRQGVFLNGKFGKKNGILSMSASTYMGREARGEGTIEARQFSRWQIESSFLFNEQTVGWKSQLRVSSRYRKDQTKRDGLDYLPQVNLQNEIASLGVEWLFQKKWELMLGIQRLDYKGLEMLNVRDFNGEIINFKEWEVDGSEWMNSVGMRYFFSPESYLSLQHFNWNSDRAGAGFPKYAWGQWMLMYQMNF